MKRSGQILSAYLETLESRRLFSAPALSLAESAVAESAPAELRGDGGILVTSDDPWGRQITIVQTDAGEALSITGWVGSGSIDVRFDDAFIDETGRWTLPLTIINPGNGLGGYCDMKQYSHEARLPEAFDGEIVLRTTEQRRNLISASPGEEGDLQFEIEFVSTTDMILRAALPALPTEPDLQPLPIDPPSTTPPELPAMKRERLIELGGATTLAQERPIELLLSSDYHEEIGG